MEASKFDIVTTAVNCIRLNVGEEKLKEYSLLLKKFGAAVLVMEFDEGSQTSTADVKVQICHPGISHSLKKSNLVKHKTLIQRNVDSAVCIQI